MAGSVTYGEYGGFLHLVGEERAQRRVERRHVERDERAPLVGAPLGAAVAVDELLADRIKVNGTKPLGTNVQLTLI